MGKDLYTEITERICEQLESGIIPWEKPWTGARIGARSHSTGKAYSIINQLMLGKPGEYITFNQCKAEGGKVKKGAKAKTVVFWKPIAVESKDADGNPIMVDGKPEIKMVPFLRYYNVFHIDDCEGIEARWTEEQMPEGAQAVEEAENVFRGYLNREGIRLEEEMSDDAFYSPRLDYIHLPKMEQFAETAEYYSTAFHESVHSTGHESRLARFEKGAGAAAFGSESYSKEELVAEIGSACILHELGLETKSSFRNNSAYIQSWLKVLKNDKKFIISAAGKAQKAVERILNITE